MSSKRQRKARKRQQAPKPPQRINSRESPSDKSTGSKGSDNQLVNGSHGKNRMDILALFCIAGAGICAIFCTILLHQHLAYAGLWTGCAGAIFFIIACGAGIHSLWSKAETKDLPQSAARANP